MVHKKHKKSSPDYFSGAVFLFVVFAIPLTYYYGVARPQNLQKRASAENKMLRLVRDFQSPSLIRDTFNVEINKPEGAQDVRFDMDENGVVNGVDYDLILKNYENQ
jgi:hypothetical protein